MESAKFKTFYNLSIILGVILIASGLILFIPRSVRSDTPDIYFYNIYILRYVLPISGILLIIIGSSMYSIYRTLKEEINALTEKQNRLEKELRK
ncbi:hypothetical protein BK126_10105 [Paenibacillus sp. FSL H7-0326]|nr:hypothetical protein BK126_10105 [Paenibacillus sp. FSL H7-0326]SDX42645.1 hypothetical protein SAMN05518848_107123 [Paenibacillus sp. PDC88]